MQEIRANTSVKVKIGPFVDVTDGFTPETAVTLTGGGDNADEAEVLKHDNSTTVDISANTWAAVTGCDGYYDLTLSTSNTDTPGNLTVVIQNDSVHLPVKCEFSVLSEFAWDAKFGTEGTGGGRVQGVIAYGTAQAVSATSITLEAAETFAADELNGCIVLITSASTGAGQARFITDYGATADVAVVDTWTTTPTGTVKYAVFAAPPANATNLPAVNVTQIGGSSTAGTNAKAAYDGTGYAGGTTKQQVVLANGAHGGSSATLTLDSTTFTTAPSVNVSQINGATVTGDGNATPWDGA